MHTSCSAAFFASLFAYAAYLGLWAALSNGWLSSHLHQERVQD